MAWFKWGQQSESVAADAPIETAQTLRKRALRRLVGAATLLAAVVIGFPLLFETQPRPSEAAVDIHIPDKNKIAPLTLPQPVGEPVLQTPAAQASQAGSGPASAQRAADASAVLPAAPAASAAPETVTKPQQAPKAQTDKAVPTKTPADKAGVAVTIDKQAESRRAKALLEGKPASRSAVTSSAGDGAKERYVVQFGSFAEVAKARESRRKVEAAGLSTYSQVVNTPEGARYRVRVGPFTQRAAADKAAAKVKSLGFSASVLSL